jgi:hypothetical protein
VYPCRRNARLQGWCGCLVLLSCLGANAWGDTDKTIVDLEISKPRVTSNYHRPKWARQYTYDGTEIDLVVPRPSPAPDTEQPVTPLPNTTAPSAPAPVETPSPPVPEGR